VPVFVVTHHVADAWSRVDALVAYDGVESAVA